MGIQGQKGIEGWETRGGAEGGGLFYADGTFLVLLFPFLHPSTCACGGGVWGTKVRVVLNRWTSCVWWNGIGISNG